MKWLATFLAMGLILGGAFLYGSEEPRSPGGRLTGLLSNAPSPEPGVRVLHQFVDDAGVVRIVESLDEVPADRRAGVGRIEVPVEPVHIAKATSAPEITIYTTSWCGFCTKMVAELESQRVRYRNRDIERDPRARAELLELVGSTGVPVTVVDRQVIRGYDPDRLRRLLSRAG